MRKSSGLRHAPSFGQRFAAIVTMAALVGVCMPRVHAAPPGGGPSRTSAAVPGPGPGAPTLDDPEMERVLAEARLHFEAGTEHYANGRFEEAIKRFQAGYALVPRPNFLVNIGQAYRKLGNLVRAKEAYVAYVRALPENSALRDQALQVLAEIEVQLQDQPSYTPLSDRTDSAAVTPVASAVAPGAPPAPARLGTWLGLGVGGAGVALLATGLGFQLRAQAAGDTLAEASRRMQPFDPEEERAGRRAERIGNGLFAAGGAVMAVALVLYLVVDGAGSTRETAARPQVAIARDGFALGWRF